MQCDQNDKTASMYSKSSLENICHTLNKNLHEAGYYIDITRDPRFINSQKAYKEACLELKSVGKAVVKNYPEIKHKGNIFVSIHY